MEHLKRQIKYKLWVEAGVIKLQFTHYPNELRNQPTHLAEWNIDDLEVNIASVAYPDLRTGYKYIDIMFPGKDLDKDSIVVVLPYNTKHFNVIKQALERFCGRGSSWTVSFAYSRVAQMRRGVL